VINETVEIKGSEVIQREKSLYIIISVLDNGKRERICVELETTLMVHDMELRRYAIFGRANATSKKLE
jgi:hypothetical protein